MTDTLIDFFNMGGYGTYVFSAYGSVLVYLLIQWFIPWRRRQKFLREQKMKV